MEKTDNEHNGQLEDPQQRVADCGHYCAFQFQLKCRASGAALGEADKDTSSPGGGTIDVLMRR